MNCLCALVLPVFAPAASWAADAANAQSYALRIPVLAAPDASLQRLVLPASAMVKLQTTGYNDIRIFNAQGQAVPMALTALALARQADNQEVVLKASPILGASNALDGSSGGVSSLEGLSLRIEEQQGKRVVQINTANAGATGIKPAQTVFGALLDARAISTPVVAMALDVDLPNAQPITFRVQASKDLKVWRPLADTVLYRADGAAGSADLGSAKLELNFADIKDCYLRITWSDAAGQLAPVTLRGATLTTSRATSIKPRVTATMALAESALTSPHELSFSLPFAAPVAALKIRPQGVNVLIPVRVLGRNASGQAWTYLGSTVLYNMMVAGKLQSSGALELPGTSFREMKIEADKKTPGFSGLPEIMLEFGSVQVVFLTSGPGPFTLAVGLANAASAYLPIQSLMPGYQNAQENTLPLARTDEAAAVATGVMVPAQITSDRPSTRSLVLWGVLLAGALVLGLMAWTLLRQTKKPSTQGG